MLAIGRVDKSSGLFFESLMGTLLMQTNEALLQTVMGSHYQAQSIVRVVLSKLIQTRKHINNVLTSDYILFIVSILASSPTVCGYKYFY